jgi:hypothetical protein
MMVVVQAASSLRRSRANTACRGLPCLFEQATSDKCVQRAGQYVQEGGSGKPVKKREFVVRAGVKRRR